MPNHGNDGWQPTAKAGEKIALPPNVSFIRRRDDKYGISIKEMATQIACSLYQSSEVMKDTRLMMEKDEIENNESKDMSVMQYIAITAVETARLIDQYSKRWDGRG